MKEKVDPYLRPLYDALNDCLPAEQVERRIASGEIEIAPIAFMRGRTLADAFIILDEAQNTTPAQMKMFLTRFGQNSRMVVCGDPNQTDLPGGMAASGLNDAVTRLEGVEGIAVSPLRRRRRGPPPDRRPHRRGVRGRGCLTSPSSRRATLARTPTGTRSPPPPAARAGPHARRTELAERAASDRGIGPPHLR